MADLDETRPKWRQVHAVISERIADGTYPPGSKVPSVMGLQAEFGIAVATAQKVLRALKAEEAVRTEPGLGTFVADQPADRGKTAGR